ncbi:hypothetical protein Z945_1773 [Sulfitobacter noctilucae]|nr:hypothetical protein Z945_1773 [Sulfitobacter noctilucae]
MFRACIPAGRQSSSQSGVPEHVALPDRFNFAVQVAVLKGGRIRSILWVGLAKACRFCDSPLEPDLVDLEHGMRYAQRRSGAKDRFGGRTWT